MLLVLVAVIAAIPRTRASCRRETVSSVESNPRIRGIPERNVRKWGGSSKGYWRIADSQVLPVAAVTWLPLLSTVLRGTGGRGRDTLCAWCDGPSQSWSVGPVISLKLTIEDRLGRPDLLCHAATADGGCNLLCGGSRARNGSNRLAKAP